MIWGVRLSLTAFKTKVVALWCTIFICAGLSETSFEVGPHKVMFCLTSALPSTSDADVLVGRHTGRHVVYLTPCGRTE